MSEAVTEKVLARLVTLADTLVTGFDVVELDDERGHLRVLASSDEAMHVLELLELQNGEGPCYEAFTTGQAVVVPELPEAAERWPTFYPAASAQGVAAVYALPLRLRDRTIGALNLLGHTPGERGRAQFEVAHALATMATLGILNHWTARRQELLAEQLQVALNSRVVIEQAKGVIAERSGVDMPTAFEGAPQRGPGRPPTPVRGRRGGGARTPVPDDAGSVADRRRPGSGQRASRGATRRAAESQ